MTSIVRASTKDSLRLSNIAKQTFIESHGRSAPQEDIDKYISEKYTEQTLKDELSKPENIYHLLFYKEEFVGFSKIMLNIPYTKGGDMKTAKMDRIFLLEKVYDLKLGRQLLRFNLNLMKEHLQTGAWLYVWTENARAIQFYKRNGFRIVGSHDFRISANHTNPNHLMFLDFSRE